MKRFALILSAALASCDSHNPPKPQSTPIPEAELMKMMKYATEHHSVLLGAKYHLPAQTVQVITADYRSHQLLVWQALASPAPSEETMQQTIDRLSTTYKLPQDVLASLIMDWISFSAKPTSTDDVDTSSKCGFDSHRGHLRGKRGENWQKSELNQNGMRPE